MGSRLLLIVLSGFQIVVCMDSNQQDNETQIVAATLKKVTSCARAAHTPQDFLANLKELIYELGKSTALFTIVDPVTESHIKLLPSSVSSISTPEDMIVTWNLFKSMNDDNRIKLINRVLRGGRYELLMKLIISDGKEMVPLFPSGSSLHDQMTALVPEFIKLNDHKLNRKRVIGFFADIGIDFTKTDNKELFNAAVIVNSASLVELFFSLGIEHSSHLSTTLTPHPHYAASLPDGEKLLATLYRHNYTPNAQDPKTMSTVLMIFCSNPNNNIETIQNFVLEKNVDLNMSNSLDATALTCACISGFWQAALFLLDQHKLSLGFPPNTAPKGKTQYEKTLDALKQKVQFESPGIEGKKKDKCNKRIKEIEESKEIAGHYNQVEKLRYLIKSCSKLDSQAH